MSVAGLQAARVNREMKMNDRMSMTQNETWFVDVWIRLTGAQVGHPVEVDIRSENSDSPATVV
jgi:hypothetical protein